ncbi:unnamed protein product, partial [Didymodactylos carnosus]
MTLVSIVVYIAVLIISINCHHHASHVYTFDEYDSGPEQCCVVRTRKGTCHGTLISRTLVLVTKDCHHRHVSDRRQPDRRHFQQQHHHHGTDILDTIVRRLSIKKEYVVGDKILIELKAPVSNETLGKSLVCLPSKNTSRVDLKKCYISAHDDQDHSSDSDDLEHHNHHSHKHEHNDEDDDHSSSSSSSDDENQKENDKKQKIK